jgi:8-oxo-dGTP diphosphatase
MAYEKARIAVDAVILSVRDREPYVLLRAREKEPFRGKLELPGGLLRPLETAEHTLKRKLKDTIGSANRFCKEFHTFTRPDRDPRDRTVSIGYYALVEGDTARHLRGWCSVRSLRNVAFDHKEVISEALRHIRKNISPNLVANLLPKEFPLNMLQEVYEALLGVSHDNRNFRKKMKSFVEETGKKEEGVSHRPAKLYRIISPQS